MSTYVIGDIHGCFDELQLLLASINFSPEDKLWCVGDYVNGGSQPLETLRFLRSLGNQALCILGNHDLILLATAYGHIPEPKDRKHGFSEVLKAKDCDDILQWLKQCPLAHFDKEKQLILVHAGFPPQWSISEVMRYANQVSEELKTNPEFLANILGNDNTWSNQLTKWQRMRYIVNCLTRIRFCSNDGKLELTAKGKPSNPPAGYFPWYKLYAQTPKVFFGHWAALEGVTGCESAIALDTGCVWGNKLTALRLEDSQFFSVNKLQ